MNEQPYGTVTAWQNPRVQQMLLVVLVVLAVFIAAQTVSEFKEFRFIGSGVPASNTISVSGTGEVVAVPDIAVFTFSTIEKKDTAAEAQDASAKKMNDAIAFLKGEGLEEKDIKTVGYNVYPVYEYPQTICSPTYCPPAGEAKLTGYEVRQSVEVKVRDTARAGELLSGVGSYGISEISGISFSIDEPEELQAQARTKAIEDAQQKAQQLADSLGVDIVRIVGFNESGYYPYYAKYDMALEATGRGGADAASVPALPMGENTITSNVNVTYEIR
jgi:uncharacterized protein YggE